MPKLMMLSVIYLVWVKRWKVLMWQVGQNLPNKKFYVKINLDLEALDFDCKISVIKYKDLNLLRPLWRKFILCILSKYFIFTSILKKAYF